MKECDILRGGGQNILLHIFMGSRPPTPRIYTALADPLKRMCYHAEFGRSESNAEGRVQKISKLWGTAP